MTSDSIRAQTLMDLLVAATMFLLKDPGMSLDEIMQANWQSENDDETAAEMVRRWLE